MGETRTLDFDDHFNAYLDFKIYLEKGLEHLIFTAKKKEKDPEDLVYFGYPRIVEAHRLYLRIFGKIEENISILLVLYSADIRKGEVYPAFVPGYFPLAK